MIIEALCFKQGLMINKMTINTLSIPMENIIMHIYRKKIKSKNPKCRKNVFCSQMRFLFSTKPQKTK